ncbi:choice-of-anchor M domain-containing protein [Streptomyces sp. NBC_00620]|uniref:choice-of-anchor M domain-containing protein n=1 Tax=unclassified Streptomyces TaxID=2593676 RepID=UPI00224D991A|nr:choice-of-anchor M domain-containing protein [Streptomyces sp. NBC_00620]MCX4971877.1 choice-of-anchor M domain-containing protein [Streptomyces sp. NBC_00620]WUC13603.1 choice-of-anchor M domain-containing protein [Streptomyces sp. NBC_00564]
MSKGHTYAAAVITAAAVLTGAAGLVAGGTPPARAASGAVVLDEGAVDLTPRLVDGELQLQIDDRTTDTEVVREPSEVVWHVVPEAKSFVEGPLQGPLGSLMDAWYLNGWEADQIFALEPGWNGTEAGSDTEVTLTGFEGPGGFALYDWLEDDSYNDIPPDVHLASDPAANTSYTLGKDTEHAVPTWGFGTEGVYRLTFRASTTLADGTVSSDTETLAVAVGNVDPTDVLPGDGSTPTPTPSSSPPTETVTPTGPAAHVIDDGHLDLAARPVDGGLRFQIKEGTAYDYEWYEPDEVVLHVVPAAKKKITSDTAFLGAEGDPVWWLPLAQVSGILWPGWNTEEWEPSALDGQVTYRVDSLQGPGTMAVFSGGSLSGWDLWINSGDGLPDSFHHSVDAHSHSYWAFTQEGVYRTKFTVSATLADGTKVSDTATIAWVVGDDVDPSTVNPGAGGEATATPTAGASGSESPTGTASSSTSAAPSAEPSASPAGATPAASSSSRTPTTATGALASTGSGVLVPLGASVAALVVGSGAVWAVRRRKVQR